MTTATTRTRRSTSDCAGDDDYDQDGDGDESASKGTGTDCDDTDETVYPDADELRDAIDNNCNDICDEGVVDAGELIITEINLDPSKVSDPYGEWFEVYNDSGEDLGLCGWTMADNAGAFEVTSDIVLSPGDYAVFGYTTSKSLNGGAGVDFGYGSALALSNTADRVVITLDGTEIDRVEYSKTGGFPVTAGKSMELKSSAFDATSNNSSSAWCNATDTFGLGDYGTPGGDNSGC